MTKNRREWTLTTTQANNLPLGRYRSRTKTNGKWDTPRMCVTFEWNRAIFFKDKLDALFYLDKNYEKYGKQVFDWYPIKVDTLLKRQKKKPVLQLHTRKNLIRKKRD